MLIIQVWGWTSSSQTSSSSLTREEPIISTHYHTFCHCKRVFFQTPVVEILFFQVVHYPPPQQKCSVR